MAVFDRFRLKHHEIGNAYRVVQQAAAYPLDGFLNLLFRVVVIRVFEGANGCAIFDFHADLDGPFSSFGGDGDFELRGVGVSVI